MVEKGIGRMLAFVVNSQDYFERVQAQGRFERQVRALNQALGGHWPRCSIGRRGRMRGCLPPMNFIGLV